MTRLIPALALILCAASAQAADTALWRLECGKIDVADMSAFSDTFTGAGQAGQLTNSCYLIRHDDDYMIWDTGLPAALIDNPVPAGPLTPSLTVTIADQLAQLDVAPADIGRVGISHYHFDHVGQATTFPQAELLIGAADMEAIRTPGTPFADPALVAPWLDGGTLTEVQGDHDVFGDGSVVMLDMPGHTPGSMALLVRLADTGPVLLSGDVVHFEGQFAVDGVPPFNTDRADSLASMERLAAMAESLGALLIVQHDPEDTAKLPAFPEAAR